ncbi:MAG: hypothetical protein HKN04_07710 [Rhodothermaceae bacterium]|nr:hypothetical protein [Rhodothermaceae bacterium]
MNTTAAKLFRLPPHLVLALSLIALATPARAGDARTPPDSLFSLVGGHPVLPSLTALRPSLNPHGDIGIACEGCHTAEGWTPLRDTLDFDHNEDTRFTMSGRHMQADCRSCHFDLRFDRPDLLPDACSSCHLDVHRGQLGDDCQQCHTTQDFGLVKGIEIHARTAFPLTGSHLQIGCESCHENDTDGLFAPLDPTCIACHAEDYAQTTNSAIDHVGVGFPTDCEACHTTLSFGTGIAFDHVAASGGFELLGAHNRIACTTCHNPGDLSLLFDAAGQDDCFACHEDDYAGTANSLIDHEASGLPTDCQQCHTVEMWDGAVINHVAVSDGFDLVGAHMALDCATCHRGPNFSVPENPAGQNDCFACHAEEHEEEHPNFPITCLDCHTTSTFDDADDFNHGAATGFSLVGSHLSLSCEACHTGPDRDLIWTPSGQDDCVACHQQDHEGEHPEFPTTCLDCHTTSSFDDATFDHGAATGFNLVGAHLPLDCSACHTGPNFELTWTPSGPNDCYACHAEEHEDEHPDFPTTCLDCHTTSTFDDPDFDHGATTGFNLVGAHQTAPCASCHTGPNFDLIWDPVGPNDCLTCHTTDHETAHPAFPTTCLDCHTNQTFAGATFEHEQATGFPLQGAHLPLDCASCHTGPDFELIWTPAGPNDCYTCHTDDYEGEHAGSGFPTTCLDCHTIATWDGATFNHNAYFPIYSGAHDGEWDSCETCHTQPGNFQVFTCLTCHEHRQSQTDDDHSEVSGYIYESTACYSCHPNGDS